jgi:fructokinase
MIIVAGEALVDLTPASCGGDLGYVPHPGGSTLNVAVGLARQGIPVQYLARISHDHFGRMLRDHLSDSNVNLDLVVDADELSTLAFVHVQDGEPEYSFHAEGAADRLLRPEELPPLPDRAPLHLGSISLVLEPVASTLDELMSAEAGHRVISLDPNVRPSLIEDPEGYRVRLDRWLGLVDIVKVSTADLSWLEPRSEPETIAAKWLERGPALVLVTNGQDGAFALNQSGMVRRAAPEVKVVDTVGAGDAFMSGVLAHLYRSDMLRKDALATLDEQSLADLLDEANLIAADTCTRPGAEPPWRRP